MKANRSSPAKLVVVIDDDRPGLEAAGGLLRSWGFQVVTAISFGEALQQLMAMRRRPDLIVSDYRLSERETGVDAIEALRCAFEIPALVISGDANCPWNELGRDGYQILPKPINAKALQAALIEACMLQR